MKFKEDRPMKAKAILTVILLLAAGFTAAAEGIWTVTSSTSGTNTTFAIKRTDATYPQTVLYRTVGLSAFAGQHYNAVSGSLTFAAGETSKTVTVSESISTANTAYWFQSTGTSRTYRLDVTNRSGEILATCTRNVSTGTGTQLSTSYLNKDIYALACFDKDGDGSITTYNGNKYLDVAHSGSAGTWIKVTDKGYSQAVHTMSTDALYGNTVQRTFYDNQDTKMYATVYFSQKEEDDGYQYIQIYSSSYDNDDDPNGGVNDPVNSLYKACFILSYTPSGSVMSDPHMQFFPHRWDYEDRNAQYNANKWSLQEFDYDNSHLYAQKFKTTTPSLRDDKTGSLVLSPTVAELNVRFDAGGSGNDTWYFKDMKLRLALLDATAPTVLASSVAPGRHAKGNILYLCVAFSEPVTINSGAKLTTNWGELGYLSGNGTNVISFHGAITGKATGSLNITGLSGTVADLAGNKLSGGITASGLCELDADLAYTLSDFQQDGGDYLITCHDDLIGLAGYVNGGNNASGLTFRQVADIAFPHTTDWNDANSTENNYIAIGNYSNPFQGTFDGQNHTISGIRIYKGRTDSNKKYQGIFGRVTGGGTVKRVNLADARITANDESGGIVGSSFKATIEDCTAGADVCIHAVEITIFHGGILGYSEGSIVQRCISRATLSVADGLTGDGYGGVTGINNVGTITDCVAVGAVIPNVKGRGAITGSYTEGSTITRNFYRDCKVASNVVTPSGVGLGIDSSTTTNDADGARPVFALTLPANTSVVRTAPATLPGIGNASYTNGADIAGTAYYTGGATHTLTPEQGFNLEDVSVNGTAATNNGDGTWSFTMPAADATVTALMGMPYIDENGNEQTCTDFTLVGSSYAFGDDNGTATLGVDDNVERWYAVVGTVSLDKPLNVYGNAHLILCDGAALNINADNDGAAFNIPASNGSDFTIYGQAQGIGTLRVTNTRGIGGRAIDIKKNTTINGGSVIASSKGNGIVISGTLTINRGIVTATGEFEGISVHPDCTITQNGGTLNATSGNNTYYAGIYAHVSSTVNILGGIVTATGTGGAYGIRAHASSTVNILGGIVTATGDIGIYADDSPVYILGGILNATGSTYGIDAVNKSQQSSTTLITLGWTTPDDRITASSIYFDGDATLQVRDGQTLYADDVPYSGDITASAGDLAGKTLAPYQGAGSGTSAVTARKASFAGVERYWTTFYSATRYALPAGAQAFIMKSDHVLYRIGDGSVIPAGCAVVIMADASALTNPTATGGIITITETTAAEPSVSGNILLGVDTPTSAPSGAHVLSKVGDDFGFFTFTGTIPANKAYYVE